MIVDFYDMYDLHVRSFNWNLLESRAM